MGGQAFGLGWEGGGGGGGNGRRRCWWGHEGGKQWLILPLPSFSCGLLVSHAWRGFHWMHGKEVHVVWMDEGGGGDGGRELEEA